MGACGCSLAGSKACFTCPNGMSGIVDRYPVPYTGNIFNWPEKFVEPDWKRQQNEASKRLRELCTKVREAHEKAGKSTLLFGEYQGDGDLEEQVAPI